MTFLLVLVITVFVCGCKKSEEVIIAEKAVKAIGVVSLDSGDVIKKAEVAVANLNDEDKKKFKMTDVLDEAKNEYEKLATEEAISEVEDAISQIGEISMDNFEVVNSAQEKYDRLSSDAKAMVKNYDVLSYAQEKLSADKKVKAYELLSAMKIGEDRIKNYKIYYPSGWKHYSDGWAADIKSFVLPYIGINDNVGESEIEILKAIASSNETIVRFEGDDYYQDVIISAEDKKGIADALLVYQLLK